MCVCISVCVCVCLFDSPCLRGICSAIKAACRRVDTLCGRDRRRHWRKSIPYQCAKLLITLLALFAFLLSCPCFSVSECASSHDVLEGPNTFGGVGIERTVGLSQETYWLVCLSLRWILLFYKPGHLWMRSCDYIYQHWGILTIFIHFNLSEKGGGWERTETDSWLSLWVIKLVSSIWRSPIPCYHHH